MKSSRHVVVSGVISIAIFAINRNIWMALMNFIVGTLIDADHYLDYIMTKGRLSFNLPELFRMCYAGRLDRIFILFHSYEMLAALLILAYFERSPVYLGVVIGYSQHFILDFFSNPVYKKGFSIIYRLKNGFAHSAIAKW